MQYRPEHTDLLEAIQDFLIKEILPFVKHEDVLAYKTLVSWNMLGVVGRELKNGRPLLEKSVALLADVCDSKLEMSDLPDHALLQKAHQLSREAARKIRAQHSQAGGDDWNKIKEVLKYNLEIENPRFGT